MSEVEFDGVIIEQQTFLDGMREITVDAAAVDGPWRMTVMVRWPQAAEAGPDEGDLTLVGPGGDELNASLRQGRIELDVDDDTGDEVIRFDLTFQAGAGERTVRLRGTLTGETARFSAIIAHGADAAP